MQAIERTGVPFREMNVCDAEPTHGDLGHLDARVVTPGDPGASVLLRRMQDLGAHRMPPLATRVVDEGAVAVVGDWIESLTECP